MMASAIAPTNPQQDHQNGVRPTSSTDRQSHPPPRRHGPTTPLRRVSRGSFSKDRQPNDPFPLDSLEPAFAELSDALTDLNANFEQLQDMHSSLARFSESFASFLYGLNMNAFCNEFPQVWSLCLGTPVDTPGTDIAIIPTG
jgi:DASH complex subunit DAM1